jgi:hypothetical protein
MALIWVDGRTGAEALAPAWREYMVAKADFKNAKANPDDAQRFAAAFKAKRTAKAKYETLVVQAEQALAQLANQGKSRTHVLVVGVGKYDSSVIIPTVTTSIHGARAFADWVLARFSSPDRPLGSVEFLSSPAPGQGDWVPSNAAAVTLGLDPALALPTEPATFSNIQAAFERWLRRSGAFADNAAIWYFGGHGLFKSEALLLPQDAELPSETQSARNLIAPTTTLNYMQNRLPRVQCFFIDACSENNLDLIYNVQKQPGRPLCTPTNSSAIADRDATIYFGSYAGGKAYGPADAPPYFTQELLLCLERRGGDPGRGANQVTMSSLASALKAAASRRRELENNFDIKFSESKPGIISGTGELCELRGPVEVFAQIACLPAQAMEIANIYVEMGGKRVDRPAPRGTAWCTMVEPGQCTAGAMFDRSSGFGSVPYRFFAVPPVMDISLRALVQSDGGGNNP